MWYRIFSLLLLCLSTLSAATTVNTPTKVAVGYLNTDNGLSHNTIFSIYTDEFGLVWIATGDGLNRFDGENAELIKTPSNIVTGVCGDKSGHIFIKGHHTLYRMDMETLQVSTISSQNVECMDYSSGALYWASDGKILKDGIEVVNLGDEAGNSILDITVDDERNIYAATGLGEIIRISEGSRTVHYTHPDVLFLDRTPDGSIWACSRTEGILRILKDGTEERYKVEGTDDLDENNVRSVVQKGPEEYYVGTYKGLFLLNTAQNSYTPLSFQPGLNDFSNEAVKTLSYDGETLFIGTYHAGLHYYRERKHIRTLHGLSSPVVSAIAEDRNGNVWIGTVSGGLNILDEKSPLPAAFKKKILSEPRLKNVKYILYDEYSNSVWVALFSEGMFRIDLDRYRLDRVRIPFYPENITKIQMLTPTRLLCYCIDGLFTIDTETLNAARVEGFPFKSERAVDFQMDGSAVWVAGANAVYKMESLDNPADYIRYPLICFPEIRDENSITTVFKSNSGRILLCTDGSGIYSYNPDTDTFIHELGDNVYVNDICQGKGSDIILVSTNNGLLKIDDKEWKTTCMGRLNGYPFSTVSTAFETSDSTMLVCGSNTVFVLDRKSPSDLFEDYSIHIKSAYAEGAELSPSPLFSRSIKLRGPVNSLSFRIVNNCFEKSLGAAYEYVLEGFDRKYNQSTGPTINYTNIQPGKYKLIVRGTIRTTSGDVPTVELPILITPPFYRTTVFYGIVVLFIITVLAAILYGIARSNRLKMELKMEKHEDELFRKFSNDKAAFISGFAERFKAPLAVINSNIEALLRKEKFSPKSQSNVQEAYRNLKTLNSLVEKISSRKGFIEEPEEEVNPDDKTLKAAISIIEKNLTNESFGINEFASGLCMSRTMLFNKIKQLTGLTPNAFILSIKLKKAASEIETNPDESTSSIAYRCGFATPSYFIKCFKRYFGQTPVEYKKSCNLREPLA